MGIYVWRLAGTALAWIGMNLAQNRENRLRRRADSAFMDYCAGERRSRNPVFLQRLACNAGCAAAFLCALAMLLNHAGGGAARVDGVLSAVLLFALGAMLAAFMALEILVKRRMKKWRQITGGAQRMTRSEFRAAAGKMRAKRKEGSG